MGPARNPNPRPRRQGGGRSVSYSARREDERGTVGQHAAEWSDAAARSVFSALHEGRVRQGLAICKFTEGILSNLANDNQWRSRRRTCEGMSSFIRRETGRRRTAIRVSDEKTARLYAGEHLLESSVEAVGGVQAVDDAPHRSWAPLRRVGILVASNGSDDKGEELALELVSDDGIEDARLSLLHPEGEPDKKAPPAGLATNECRRVVRGEKLEAHDGV
ncbi:hypothetical protein AB1Y20_003772 [Prymnesium parvum]|uniref:Uncharacterized protein n=1 Tax=Prymnesium parvum TaxID=97485 RepID=A0AB34J5N5_PRYPA